MRRALVTGVQTCALPSAGRGWKDRQPLGRVPRRRRPVRRGLLQHTSQGGRLHGPAAAAAAGGVLGGDRARRARSHRAVGQSGGRKWVLEGNSLSARVGLGGRPIIKKNKNSDSM